MRTLVLCLLAGCLGADAAPPPGSAVPLAQLAGGLHAVLFGGDLLLSISSPDCSAIDQAVTATLSGVAPAAIERGSRSATGQCTRPLVTWHAPDAADGSTFVVTDGTTTWTFETPQPAQVRQLERVSPAGDTIHAGERVVVALAMPGGTLSDAYALALGLFDLDETSGVSTTETSIEFDAPAVVGDTTLSVGAKVALPVITCTAPDGCEAFQAPEVAASVSFR